MSIDIARRRLELLDDLVERSEHIRSETVRNVARRDIAAALRELEEEVKPMAVSVRADLTPAEFDLVRRALASHATEQESISKENEARNGEGMVEFHARKREAAGAALMASELLKKLNGPGR